MCHTVNISTLTDIVLMLKSTLTVHINCGSSSGFTSRILHDTFVNTRIFLIKLKKNDGIANEILIQQIELQFKYWKHVWQHTIWRNNQTQSFTMLVLWSIKLTSINFHFFAHPLKHIWYPPSINFKDFGNKLFFAC